MPRLSAASTAGVPISGQRPLGLRDAEPPSELLVFMACPFPALSPWTHPGISARHLFLREDLLGTRDLKKTITSN